MSERRGTFVDRVLDGHARMDGLESEVTAWAAGDMRRPLHEVLGLDAAELDLVASTPDALRYVLHSRRFGHRLAPDEVAGQRRVRAHATRLAAMVVDPFELAALEAWAPQVDALATPDAAPAHA